MQLDPQNKTKTDRHILGRIARNDFVDRTGELDRVLNVALGREFSGGILAAARPGAGSSEFLRQVFDAIFGMRDEVVPLHFSLSPRDKTVIGAAQHFLNTALAQYISYRRNDPSLCNASLATSDLIELAAPADVEWVERALVSSSQVSPDTDLRSSVRLCLGVLRKMREAGTRPMVLLDDIHVSSNLSGGISLATEFARAVLSSQSRYVFSGLRRVVVDEFAEFPEFLNSSILLKLEELSAEDAQVLVESACHRFGVQLTDQTRDLLVHELGGNPFFITSFVHAAAEKGLHLKSFRECQQLYLDELMGGRLSRHFDGIFERVSSSPTIRRNLTKVLFESRLTNNGKIGVDVLRRRLDVETEAAQEIVKKLNAFELATLSSNFLEVNSESLPWHDYLQTRYRLEVAAEPRALVFADTLIEVLKRAPQTMARHYRREASLGLKKTLEGFNCQRLPVSLFHYDRFKRLYKGAEDDDIDFRLESESELLRVPQVVNVASCSSFDPSIGQYCDEERCVVAHGFEAGSYSSTNEVVWLVVEIESKLEVGRGVAEAWCERLQGLAHTCGFYRFRLWFVSPEGFSDEALVLLNERIVYNSNRQQFEIISSRVTTSEIDRRDSVNADEFEMIIPMGEDSEIIAANTVEQIARRVNFAPEAINQIKTALVEACINASEHSLSPDRKIYQQFRVESDRLVVIVSSRGVVPLPSNGQKDSSVRNLENGSAEMDSSKGRRGWGLKLIQSLMDEVEFEVVDDGTRLRMTKYLKKP